MLHCTQSRSFGNNALHRRVSCASHLARRGLSNGRRTRALQHRCSFRAPAANPGPTVGVESYFPFAEPLGIWRGHAEDRLQPTHLHASRLPGSAEPFQGQPVPSLLMQSSPFPPKRDVGVDPPPLGRWQVWWCPLERPKKEKKNYKIKYKTQESR